MIFRAVDEWGTMSEAQPRAQTPVNPKPVFIVESEVKFTRDLSNFWYKPNASREETISALRFQPLGSFIIRASNSFPGAYGLAIKVNESTTTEDSVRHFLIEPTKYGVRLRGSAVEPVFGESSPESTLSPLIPNMHYTDVYISLSPPVPTSDSAFQLKPVYTGHLFFRLTQTRYICIWPHF